MGSLVFQATLGGQVNLNGPNTASTFDIAVPATTGTMVTTGDTGTVTNTMLAASAYNTPGTIGSGTANTGAFTTLSASSTVSGTGFSTYLASPPAIGGTAAAAGTFTTLSGTTSVTTPIVKSASSLTLQSNGTTTAVTVDTSQNVGIGTTSPAAKLHVGPLNGTGSLNGYTKVAIEATDYAVLTLKCPAANTSQIIFTDTTSAGLGFINYYNSSNATPNAMAFSTAGTERMRIDSNGRVLVGLTSANTSGSNFQVSQGITFPATQSPSSDVNTLDDYEEGTWTPTVASASGSITSYSSSGQYIKIGSLVVLQFQYIITNNGTGSGSINVSNLPFAGTANTSAGVIREIAVNGFTGSVYLNGTTTLSASVYNSTYPGGTNYNVKGTVSYQAT
jgi:hypothetical protein